MSDARTYNLPQDISALIAQALKDLGADITDSARIADCVLKTSDFYIQNPESPTPWKEAWCQIAQVAYFFPLNFLRNQAVLDEAVSVGFPVKTQSFLDFGSGLGAGSLPWLRKFGGRAQFIERAPQAHRIHQKLWKADHSDWHADSSQIEKFNPHTLVFSYSLTELQKVPSWALKAESLVILEPATREDGRKLLAVRQNLIDEGFHIWAPCPHQLSCPLLKNSKSDWCHDRIHLEMPDWFLEIERHLPIKNKTLTFSYLLASKQQNPSLNFWRITGDQLEEKGKTRQMICRTEDREFLTWLHRFGPAPTLHRYDKINYDFVDPTKTPNAPRLEKR